MAKLLTPNALIPNGEAIYFPNAIIEKSNPKLGFGKSNIGMSG
jgi:hypothetical protein